VPNGSGTNWGQCTLNGNPLPHTETRNALLDGLRKWVMNGTPMVPSRYPTLIGNNMVEPTKLAIGFPTIPGLPPSAPDGLVTPVIDYDFGPRFSKTDESGIIDMMPPALGVVLKTAVPRVDADGNEVGGVPAVLHDAPLGTYTGWNITAAGFYKDRICSFTGGMIHSRGRRPSALPAATRDRRSRSAMEVTRGTSRRFRPRRTTLSTRGSCSTPIEPR
jgi:hypothetical protein